MAMTIEQLHLLQAVRKVFAVVTSSCSRRALIVLRTPPTGVCSDISAPPAGLHTAKASQRLLHLLR
jgi:hypothetical protein